MLPAGSPGAALPTELGGGLRAVDEGPVAAQRKGHGGWGKVEKYEDVMFFFFEFSGFNGYFMGDFGDFMAISW